MVDLEDLLIKIKELKDSNKVNKVVDLNKLLDVKSEKIFEEIEKN